MCSLEINLIKEKVNILSYTTVKHFRGFIHNYIKIKNV